jgi:uncharacterized damage-inducible protein DinB
MSNPFLVQLFEHKAWCNRGLIEALRAAPADTDRLQMAIVLLTLEHTGIVDQIFKARLTGGEHGFTEVAGNRRPDIDQLAETLTATDAWYIDYAEQVTDDELETMVDFTYLDGDPGHMTKGQILGHLITHGASHRGAIGKMLESLGVAGTSDMMTTFRRPDAVSSAER